MLVQLSVMEQRYRAVLELTANRSESRPAVFAWIVALVGCETTKVPYLDTPESQKIKA